MNWQNRPHSKAKTATHRKQIMSGIAQAIIDGRIAANLTQRELAKAAGVSSSTIAHIERGKTAPRIDTADEVLRVLGGSLAIYVPKPETEAKFQRYISASHLVDLAADALDVEAESLRADIRRAELVRARRAVAIVLDERGFSYGEIGRALHKDHSTIYYYLTTAADSLLDGDVLRAAQVARIAMSDAEEAA